MKTIYSKYNSHRAPEFRIRTSILEENGKRRVIKTALSKEATEHIKSMPQNREKLITVYNRVTPVGCKLEKNGISFDYIHGERLDKDIDYALDELSVIREKILKIFDVIFDFDNGKVSGGMVCPANVDTIISNFAKTPEGVFLYDYEWVEYEPVPVNYLKYRSILYCYYENAEKLGRRISIEGFLKLFGYSEKAMEIYNGMEECFQEYVHGKSRKFMYSINYEKPITRYTDRLDSLDNTILGLQDKVDDVIKRSDAENKRKDSIIDEKDKELRRLVQVIYENNLQIGVLSSTLRKKQELIDNIKHSVKNPFFGVSFAVKMIRKKLSREELRTPEDIANYEKDITGDYDYWVRKKEAKVLSALGEEEKASEALGTGITVILVNTGDEAALAVSRGSIEGQNYEELEIIESPPFAAELNKAVSDAKGEYIGFVEAGDTIGDGILKLYKEKILKESTPVIYCDEDSLDCEGIRTKAYFKPDFGMETLEAMPLISRFFLCNKKLIKDAGGFDEKRPGSLLYDLTLRVARLCEEKNESIGHIGLPLYHNRIREDGNSKSIYDIDPADYEDAVKVEGTPFIRRIYNPTGEPLVSIVIPSKDNPGIFETLIYSLTAHTEYKGYEVILVDNGSNEENKAKYEEICNRFGVKYMYSPMEFNFSKMCNMGAAESKGEYLLFLNDDMEITSGEWLHRMLGAAERPGAGAVGAKLLFPGGEIIQHIGVINGVSGPSHIHARLKDEDTFPEYRNRLDMNVIAVTAACLLVKRSKYEEVGGFDEDLKVAYNDVDFCFKLYERGYRNIQRNDAVLIHHESLSRGQDTEDKGKLNRLLREKDKLYEKHPALCKKDPFYSDNYDTFYSAFPVNLDGDYDYFVKEAGNYPKGEQKNCLYNFDAITVTWGIHILGWVVFEDMDNTKPVTMLFKNKADGRRYELNLRRRIVKDLEVILPQISYGRFGGFRLMADRTKVPAGVYEIGFVFAGREYSTDREIEIDDYKAD